MKRKISSALKNQGEGLCYHVGGELKSAVNLSKANIKKHKGGAQEVIQKAAEQYVSTTIRARSAAKTSRDVKAGKDDVIEFAKRKEDADEGRATKMVQTKAQKKINQQKKMANLKQNKPSVRSPSP